MSEQIVVTIDIEGEKAGFSVKHGRDLSATKHQVSSVLRMISANLPETIPGEQPVAPMTMPPSVLAALLFVTDEKGNVTLSLHENQGAELRVAWGDIASSIHKFADQMEQHSA